MAAWLKQCGRRTVAMQSTGVYWVAAYDILEQAGFEVYLVNARDTKNLPGRKSDVEESQRLMKLHTYGRLRNSFRPSQEIRVMRTYRRQRSHWTPSSKPFSRANAIRISWWPFGILECRRARRRSCGIYRATGNQTCCSC